MSPEDTSPAREAVRVEILGRLLRDATGGDLQPLARYCERFPDYEDLVREEYAALAQDHHGAPEMLGHYRLLEEVGRGGQGVVWRAFDTALERIVAVKVLSGLGPEANRTLARFEREARAAAKADHPGVCQVYEARVFEDVPFLAMRFVDGASLARVMATVRQERQSSDTSGSRAVRDTVEHMVSLVERTARALHAVHEVGVVHRDVKPGNVMVTPAGDPVVMDFGLARDATEDAALTRSDEVFGTPGYLAPEQLSEGAHAVDRRADVWSLGVTLFEAVAFERPFTAATDEGLYREILTAEAPDPRALNPVVPKDLATVIRTALEKDPDRRYQTALDLADDLARVLRHDPIVAQPPSVTTRIRRWVQRRPALASLVAILVVGLVASTYFAIRSKSHLTEWERLADGRRLANLVEAADGRLWPAMPAKIDAMSAWITDAEALIARLPEHQRALEHLRSRGTYDEKRDRERCAVQWESLAEMDRHRNSLLEERERSQVRIGELESSLPAGRPGRGIRDELARFRGRLASLQGDLAAVEAEAVVVRAQVAERHSWSFSDPRQQVRHDRLRELVSGIIGLTGEPAPTGVTLAGMRKRQGLARTLKRRLEEEDAAAWDRCVASVAAESGPYRGLTLSPIPGLVPLGIDRASGLWEFWHVMSGRRPEWEGEALGPGRVVLDPASGEEGLVLVLIPPGTFRMGSQPPGETRPLGSPNTDPDSQHYERPVHEVSLSAFLISKDEVNQGQWERTGHPNGGALRAGSRSWVGVPITFRHPATDMSWELACEVCRRWGLQLPTEAQWEFACRGGTTTPHYGGAEPATLAEIANLGDRTRGERYGEEVTRDLTDGFVESAPIGSLRANAFGLRDFLGNVHEWCRDGYYRYAERTPRPGDGLRGVLPVARFRVVRGGSYASIAILCRSAHRDSRVRGFTNSRQGFRPSLTLPWPGPLAR